MLTAKMIALVLLGFLACTSAAPHFHHHGAPPPFHDDFLHERFFQDDIFDTRSFWDELRRELLSLDTVVNDFAKRFPTSVSNEAIDGDVYRITIPLPGFASKEIVVKATKGLVMIQAIHKYDMGVEKTYIDMRTLPKCVNETGEWTYDDNILKIEFPLLKKEEGPTTDVTTEPPAFRSREEMETDDLNTNQDADTGADRGDVVETELLTNVVPGSNNAVEATTYAVDLKDEVEFVPVRQVK